MHKIKRIAPSVCFVIILSLILGMCSVLFERKESAERYSEFWEDPGEYDVWFMGNSHVYFAINPLELWKQHGIRSYDLAAPGSYLAQTYWTMMCALQYGQPKLMVLDPHKVHFDEIHPENQVEIIHTGLDSIPFSDVKVKGICDIFDTWGERLEYICKFSIYHNRWEELKEADFDVQPSVMKGFLFNTHITDKSDYQIVDTKDIADRDMLGFFYLEKIIQECQKREIDLLLIGIPFCRSAEHQRAMNTVSELAEEYGVTYLDITEERIMDYGVDYGDGGHVNLFGAKKITSYMGNYLPEHYELTDYRESAAVAEKWDADYETYLQYRLEEMCRTSEIKRYVQWLSDDRYTCYMYQKKEPTGLLAKEIARLDNITYISLEEAEKRMGEKIKGEYAFFVENDSGEIVDKAVFKAGERQ